MDTQLLEGLNPNQKEGVETVEGPVLILAGPGSGKTRVITHRIAYLVKILGVRPYNIMAVTFTNKAAREMAERLSLLVSQAVKDLTLGTFHAICARILRREGQNLGVDPGFSIYDADEQLKLVKEAIKRENLDPKNYTPGSLLSAISSAKSQLVTPEQFAGRNASHFDEIVSRVYMTYQQLLGDNHALDFDDLLTKTVRLLISHPEVLAKYQDRYVHILVDEFQDTNLAQYELVKILSARYKNICVVGDPDQSIYSWRSADIRNILNFEKDFPSAKTIFLEQNYRSTAHILELAQSVIKPNQERKPKSLWTDNEPGEKISLVETYDQQEEASFVVGEIERLMDAGAKPADFAVLYRTNAQSRVLEEAFVRHGIPYRLAAGTRFYERREIKDILSYLRLVNNPSDNLSLARAINLPPRGIGKQTLEELERFAHSKNVNTVLALELLADMDSATLKQSLSIRSFKLLQAFAVFLKRFREDSYRLRMVDLFDSLIDSIGYKDYILGQPDGEDRWQNVLELRSVAREYNDLAPGEGLSVFLESVALVTDTDDLDKVQEAVSLITLHQAKGLEFPIVFIVGLEEGLLPHYRSLDDPSEMEEERRLFYVGITRAKKHVYLVHAFKRVLMGSTQIASASRFLKGLPGHLISGTAPEESLPQIYPKAAGPSSSSPNAEPALQLKAGNKVRHPQFGEGIVITTKKIPGDYEVVVAFDGEQVSLKKLLLSFARLEKIS